MPLRPFTIAVVVAVGAAIAATPASAQPSSLVIEAAADASAGARPVSGDERSLRAPRAYLRFDLRRTPPVDRALLVVRVLGGRASGLRVRTARGTRWRERGLTRRRAPTPRGRPRRAVVATRLVAFDVTGWIRGRDVATLVVTRRRGVTRLASTEHPTALAPQLIVVTRAPGSPPHTPGLRAPESGTEPPPPAQDPQPAAPIRAAFYYPWFPEAWKQQGFDPFTRFRPSLGLYDSSAPATIARHVEQLEHAGMEAAIASWWGPGSRTDGRVLSLLDAIARRGSPLRLALYYELEGTSDPSVTQLQSHLVHLAHQYGGHPAYLRIGGRPVVFVWAGTETCAMADRWRKASAAADVHVVLKVFDGYRTCASQPNGWHQYAPAVPRSVVPGQSFAISPGFDKPGEPGPRLGRDPRRWRQDVRAMLAADVPFQLVTTFNEWGEGTSVEAAEEWSSSSGHGTYVDVLHDEVGRAAATPPDGRAAPVVAAAGDIACDPGHADFAGGEGRGAVCRQRATADLVLDREPAAVLALGDLQYERGSLADFRASYDLSWGRFKGVTHPAVGNHEYLTSGARGYFDYWNGAGAASGRAGRRSEGFYSFDVGDWHVVVLNTNCSKAGGCGVGSPQERWLRADLAAHPARCVLAAGHHPRFSSGHHGGSVALEPLLAALQRAGAEAYLAGHDHMYERFAPMEASGRVDHVSGVRQFVVGTGGKNHYPWSAAQPGSEVRNASAHGILELTLHPDRYDWRFVPALGAAFTDTGTGRCHDAP